MHAFLWSIGFWLMIATLAYPFVAYRTSHKIAYRFALLWPLYALGSLIAITIFYVFDFGTRLGFFSEKLAGRLDALAHRGLDHMSETRTTQKLETFVGGASAQRVAEACREGARSFGIRAVIDADPKTGEIQIRWVDHDDNAAIAAFVRGTEYGYKMAVHNLADEYDAYVKACAAHVARMAGDAYSEVPHVPPERPV